jgi:mRNA interferase HicA
VKRHALIKHLEDEGCEFDREGKKHTVYRNPANGHKSTVPRHAEIRNVLAEKICKDLGIKKP